MARVLRPPKGGNRSSPSGSKPVERGASEAGERFQEEGRGEGRRRGQSCGAGWISRGTGASVQSAFSLVFSSPSRSVSFLQSPSCPSFSSLVFSVGKGSVSSLQSSLVQSLRPHLLSLLTVGALRDSSQSGAVGASHACCFTEWSSGNTTQDEADVSTRVTELGVEESQTWEWKDHVFIYTLPQVTTNK
ncbi:hypothetical protein YC2023_023335 [Brassica napus]